MRKGNFNTKILHTLRNTRFLCLVFLSACSILVLNLNFKTINMNTKNYRMLCIGDSYTIGEGMKQQDRFPNQAVVMLKSFGINFDEPKIIAKTGWTTDELMDAIHDEKRTKDYDCVTLLIGVNNQYRGRSLEGYREDFKKLLNMAIEFAQGKANHVIVLSIPDWGVTPFAEGRDRKKIAEEIDLFNSINKQETKHLKAHYIDITPSTRKAANDLSLVAEDKLHPSAIEYKVWAKLVADVIKAEK